MPARRTKKAAPRKSGARRATPASARAKRSAPAKPRRRVAAAKSAAPKRAAKPARAAAPRRPKPARATKPARVAPPAPRRSNRAAAVRDLERGCDALLAAIRGLDAEAADRPMAPGKWSPRQVLLHMAYWDEWFLGVLPAAITRGRAPEDLTAERVEAANARAVASGAGLAWNDVRDLWATQRALLLGLLAAVPAKRWTAEPMLRRLVSGFAGHDRHHAAQIRAARKSGSAAFTPAFAAQAAGASAKERLLFELERGRVAVRAALQGVGPALAEKPVAAGKWTIREIVLHLSVRDRVRLEEFEALLSGRPASWAGAAPGDMDAANEAHLEPLRPLPWEAALRLLETTRDSLRTALLAAPAEPDTAWTEAHGFGATMLALARHDRHHAEQIKSARITS